MNITNKDRDALDQDGVPPPLLQPTLVGCAVVEAYGIYGAPESLLKSFVESAFMTVDAAAEQKRQLDYFKQWSRYPTARLSGVAAPVRSSVPPHVMFATPVRSRCGMYNAKAPVSQDFPAGPNFAAYLRANALGEVIETAPKYNYHNEVVVYVWSPDWLALKAFAAGKGWLSKEAAKPAAWETTLGGPSAASK